MVVMVVAGLEYSKKAAGGMELPTAGDSARLLNLDFRSQKKA